MRPADLRAEFPVLERVAYLNAGTDGPIPGRSARAASERARVELEEGRSGARYREEVAALTDGVRARLAELLGCAPAEVAITHSTTEGIGLVLSTLELDPDDEIVTTDEDHPGLLAPLAAAARRTGATVRAVPFDRVALEVSGETRLVACSHVSWITGRVVDTAALVDAGTPVLVDGAQALGAVPVDVEALGCDFYAASGQKWLCGPDGTGCLYIRHAASRELLPAWPVFDSLSDPSRPSELPLHPDARRFDRGGASGPTLAGWLASLELLAEAGWDGLQARATDLAELLAGGLHDRGAEVASRDRSTLVSWRDPNPPAGVRRLADAGIVVRDIPGRGLVRASVGAWSSEEELERLVRLSV